MSLDSLKRVLLKTKAEARAMRKGNLEARLSPKPKKEDPLEDTAAEEAAESPAEMAAEGDEAPAEDAKAKQAKEIASIKKLLARS